MATHGSSTPALPAPARMDSPSAGQPVVMRQSIVAGWGYLMVNAVQFAEGALLMMANCTRTENRGLRGTAVSHVTVTKDMSTVRQRCVSSYVRTHENYPESVALCVMRSQWSPFHPTVLQLMTAPCCVQTVEFVMLMAATCVSATQKQLSRQSCPVLLRHRRRFRNMAASACH